MAHDQGAPEKFRDPSTLTRVVQFMLSLLILASLTALLSDVTQYQLLQSSFTEAEGAADDTRQAIIGGTFVVLYVVTVIVFGSWIYRANQNARALGASGMQFTPGWSVGWYFIPFANLWKPFQAMREIWKASLNPTHWHNEPTPAILGWWWFGWIVSNALGQLEFRMTMAAKDISSLSAVSVVGVADEIVGVFAIVLALVLVTQLSRIQLARVSGP
jgi:hypothetical protein